MNRKRVLIAAAAPLAVLVPLIPAVADSGHGHDRPTAARQRAGSQNTQAATTAKSRAKAAHTAHSVREVALARRWYKNAQAAERWYKNASLAQVWYANASAAQNWYASAAAAQYRHLHPIRPVVHHVAPAPAKKVYHRTYSAPAPVRTYRAPVKTYRPAYAAPVQGSGRCGGSLPPCYVMMRESKGSLTARNPTSTAAGKWQFLSGTWNGYGGYSSAAQAPESVQDARAAQVWAGGAGCSAWSAC